MKKMSLAALLLLPSLASAQCYNYSRSYYPTYYNNVVTTYKEVLIPLFQPYPVFVDPRISYHYSSGNYLGVSLAPSIPNVVGVPAAQTQPMQTPKANEMSDIDALIDKVEKRLRERNASREQAYEPDGPPAVPGGVSYVAPRLERSWVHVLQSNCASCHTGQKSKGDVVIFSSPGKISPSFDAQAAWEAIEEGRMPPKERPRIKASDKEILRRDFGI